MRPRLFPCFAAVVAVAGCTDSDGLADDNAPTASQNIGPNGGALVSADGNLRIEFPPGAVTEETLFTIQADRNAIAGHIGEAYQVGPQVTLFVDATVIYNYGTTNLGRPPEVIAIGANAEGAWQPLTPVSLNVDATEISGPDGRISFNYGLIEPGEVGTATDSTGTGTDTDDSTTTDPSTTTGPMTSGSTSDGPTGSSTTDDSTTTGADPMCGDGISVATEVCYTEGVTFNSPTSPQAIVAADFDDDNNMDVAVVGGGATGVIEVRFGNGSGILASPATYMVGTNPVALAAATMDAGADEDLVVINRDDATVGVLLAATDGTFGAETTYAVGGTLPVALAIADFDGGGLDVVTANSGSDDVTFLSGDGAGTLTPGSEFSVTATPAAIGAGDFTGEGNLDFVTAAAANVTLNSGNGMGGFGAATDNAIGGVTSALFVGNLNDDMDLDVAVTNDTNNVVVAFGDGTTGFGGGTPYPVGTAPVAVIGDDIDRDGELDLVVVNQTDGTVSILIGNGLGAFTAPMGFSGTFNVGGTPTAVALGDFNGDNVLDIVVTNSDDDDTSILLSNP